eukprot:snap_masked-scaffold_54-processed-gene-1.51-mRNA-1 protein AED:1.00 eAED:1.00 QI:0/-1/0/0/-1/1/1/0/104
MKNNILLDMSSGIKRSKFVLIFLTKSYLDRVISWTNVQFEFNIISSFKPEKVILIKFEANILDSEEWKFSPVLGKYKNSEMFDFTLEDNWEEELNKLEAHMRQE